MGCPCKSCMPQLHFTALCVRAWVRASPLVQNVRLYGDCDIDVAYSCLTLAPNFVKIGRLSRKLSMGITSGRCTRKDKYLFPSFFKMEVVTQQIPRRCAGQFVALNTRVFFATGSGPAAAWWPFCPGFDPEICCSRYRPCEWRQVADATTLVRICIDLLW
jgi:hypothetical protein